VVQWAVTCTAQLPFDRVLPSLVLVAEITAPNLHPDAAHAVWRTLGESRCGREASGAQRTWLELFDATARRDSAAMAAIGGKLLEATRGSRNPATEYVFLATAAALLCRGEDAAVRKLVEGRSAWMRPSVHATELMLLDSLARSSAPRPSCLGAGR
jgi:hypothetical protein